MKRILCAIAAIVLVCAVNAQRFQGPPARNTFNQQQQGSQHSAGSCKENNARYPVSGQCDAYLECRDGVAEQKMCPDGLLFNANASVFAYPCQYPIDVDCVGREGKQAPNPTEDCPHQYGYFRRGQTAAECGQFTNCVDGRSFTFDCPEGLAFSVDTYRCDWPDMVPDCDAEAFLGFRCPQENVDPFFGQQEFTYFRSPVDCQRYYMCINSKPRLFNCGIGNAYNDLTSTCDGIENVTYCTPDVIQRSAFKAEPIQGYQDKQLTSNYKKNRY